MTTFVIGVTGGSGSGKSTAAEKIQADFIRRDITSAIFPADSFYRGKTQLAELGIPNFDDPRAIDWDALGVALQKLKAGESVEVPDYSFEISEPLGTTRTIEPAQVIIVDSLFALFDPHVSEHLDMSIFVKASNDCRLQRRITRDFAERGRSEESVKAQWPEVVAGYNSHIKPTKEKADIIVVNESNETGEIPVLMMAIMDKWHAVQQTPWHTPKQAQGRQKFGLFETVAPKTSDNAPAVVEINIPNFVI